MSRWLELAAKMESGNAARAINANSANNPANPAASIPNGANDTNDPPAIPSDLMAGLKRLRGMAAPRLARPEAWPGVVSDARRLASDGWAAQALKLGWTPLDLFGVVTDPEGDPDADGLAVKIRGRRVLAICASLATVADTSVGRSYLYRGNNAGAKLLWEPGR